MKLIIQSKIIRTENFIILKMKKNLNLLLEGMEIGFVQIFKI